MKEIEPVEVEIPCAMKSESNIDIAIRVLRRDLDLLILKLSPILRPVEVPIEKCDCDCVIPEYTEMPSMLVFRLDQDVEALAETAHLINDVIQRVQLEVSPDNSLDNCPADR